MPFRFNRQHALLTYAQCGDLDPFKVSDHLTELGAECIIGRERHEDGGIHLHAMISFERAKNFKNERVFDVEGHHPNIQPHKWGKPGDMYDYAIKDGDIVAGGLERPVDPGESKRANQKRKREEQAERLDEIAAMTNEDDIRTALREMLGEKYVTSFTNTEAYIRHIMKPVAKPYTTPIGYKRGQQFPELERWVHQNLDQWEQGSK